MLLLLLVTRQQVVRHPPPEKILWIGAHPDDEAFVAPLLGRSCVEKHERCSLLVMTRGEGGGDGAIRSGEMHRAADLFGASLTLWSFSDVGVDVDVTWSAEAGNHDALIRRIQSVIIAERPTVIYTFDPNHGSTCHPAHRALGALVTEAVEQLGATSPRLLLVETMVDVLPNDFVFYAATADAMVVDATNSWSYLVRDVELHASQFTPAQIEALRNTPAEQRRVFLANVPAQRYSCGRFTK